MGEDRLDEKLEDFLQLIESGEIEKIDQINYVQGSLPPLVTVRKQDNAELANSVPSLRWWRNDVLQ